MFVHSGSCVFRVGFMLIHSGVVRRDGPEDARALQVLGDDRVALVQRQLRLRKGWPFYVHIYDVP